MSSYSPSQEFRSSVLPDNWEISVFGKLVNSVIAACGDQNKEALHNFCNTVEPAWIDAKPPRGPRWPAREDKIHKSIRATFIKLCEDLVSLPKMPSLRQDDRQTTVNIAEQAEVLLVSFQLFPLSITLSLAPTRTSFYHHTENCSGYPAGHFCGADEAKFCSNARKTA